MFEFGDPHDLIGKLVVAAPVAVLAMLAALLIMRRAKKRASRQEPLHVLGKGSPADTPIETPPGDLTSHAPQPQQQGATPEMTAAELELHVQRVEASGETAVLAGLYLVLARKLGEAGHTNRSLEALRSAAGLGAKYGPKSIHGAARLELADIAFRAGDLTLACEHWQLARMAFQEAGEREAHEHVDKRMRDHGCPTDWVLTDF